MLDPELLKPSDVTCPSCGDYLPKGRVMYSSSPYCVSCDTTERKAAIKIISGKTTYSELQFTDQATANTYNKAMRRNGQSPGAAMKGQSKLR